MLGACKPVGEIDVASAAAFDIELHDAIDSAREPLVGIDCSDLTFMDLAGYHVLVAATQYAAPARPHARDLQPVGRVLTAHRAI